MTDRRKPDEGLILVPHPSLLPDGRARARPPETAAPTRDRTPEEAIHAA